LSLTADLHQTLVKRQVVHPLWEDSASLSAYIAVTGTSNIRFKEDSIYSIVTLKKGWTVFSGWYSPKYVQGFQFVYLFQGYEIKGEQPCCPKAQMQCIPSIRLGVKMIPQNIVKD
jgi:hypothetical protein